MTASRTMSGSILSLVAVAGLALGGLGCAFGEIRLDDPIGRRAALEEVQNNYTKLVRWGDYYTALRYVDPELHSEFLKRNDLELRFTDHQSGPLQLDEALSESTVTVSYRGYAPDRLIEETYLEQQVWYRSGKGNSWLVRPHFLELEPEPAPRVVPDDERPEATPVEQQAAL